MLTYLQKTPQTVLNVMVFHVIGIHPFQIEQTQSIQVD